MYAPFSDKYKLPKKWVTPEFRQLLSEEYNLVSVADYRLIQFCLLCAIRCKYGDGIQLPLSIMRQLSGDKDFTVEDIYDLPYLTNIIKGCKRLNRTTTAEWYLPEHIHDALIAEFRDGRKAGKVDFIGGESWTQYKQNQYLSEQREMMEAYDVPGHPARELIRYLHSARVSDGASAYDQPMAMLFPIVQYQLDLTVWDWIDVPLIAALAGTVNAYEWRGNDPGMVLFNGLTSRVQWDFLEQTYKFRCSTKFSVRCQDWNYIWRKDQQYWDLRDPMFYEYTDFSLLGID